MINTQVHCPAEENTLIKAVLETCRNKTKKKQAAPPPYFYLFIFLYQLLCFYQQLKKQDIRKNLLITMAF